MIVKNDGTEVAVSESLTESKLYDKLTEMTELGLIERNRGANGYCYSISNSFEVDTDMLDFASEVMPVSTVGSYLLDRQEPSASIFAFKHNMISQVVDDEVMYALFEAINEHRELSMDVYSRATKKYSTQILLPLFIMRNVQTGRQYVACWSEEMNYFKPVRLDYINLKRKDKGRTVDDYDALKEKCRELYNHSCHL